MASLYSWWPPRGLLSCRHGGGATGFLLRVYGPCRCLARWLSYLGLAAAPVLLIVPYLFEHGLPPALLPPRPPPPLNRHGQKEDHWRRAERSR
jgi:hypothetical protein